LIAETEEEDTSTVRVSVVSPALLGTAVGEKV
jgi:hypothetical protein